MVEATFRPETNLFWLRASESNPNMQRGERKCFCISAALNIKYKFVLRKDGNKGSKIIAKMKAFLKMQQPHGIPGKKRSQWTATCTGLVPFYLGTKVRLLYFADWHDNVIPLFLEANVLPITFLCYESVSTLKHDINNDKAPANIKFISKNVYCIHSYNAGLSTSGTFYG